jgi:hypothetical protein
MLKKAVREGTAFFSRRTRRKEIWRLCRREDPSRDTSGGVSCEGEVIRDTVKRAVSLSGNSPRQRGVLSGYGPKPLVPQDWLAIFQYRRAVRPDCRNLDFAGAPNRHDVANNTTAFCDRLFQSLALQGSLTCVGRLRSTSRCCAHGAAEVAPPLPAQNLPPAQPASRKYHQPLPSIEADD